LDEHEVHKNISSLVLMLWKTYCVLSTERAFWMPVYKPIHVS